MSPCSLRQFYTSLNIPDKFLPCIAVLIRFHPGSSEMGILSRALEVLHRSVQGTPFSKFWFSKWVSECAWFLMRINLGLVSERSFNILKTQRWDDLPRDGALWVFPFQNSWTLVPSTHPSSARAPQPKKRPTIMEPQYYDSLWQLTTKKGAGEK